jgi:endonuclease I
LNVDLIATKSCKKAMLMKNILFLFSLLLIGHVHGQTQTDIYKDKKGSELLNLLHTNYKPSSTLSYNNARDELWGAIAARNNDSLSCVYTDFTVYISPSASNPRTEAYNKGINCEHTWPQSMFNESQAKSDMHHLFPTRVEVNSARGSLPFDDINDNSTDKWFWLDQEKSSIPSVNINQYSELKTNSLFEVREDHKGNVARALFYFYTMYKNDSEVESSKSLIYSHLSTLYQWHYQDPVDEEEEWRNNFIASKQATHNPYIQDSTLVRRAFFPQYTGWVNSSVALRSTNNKAEIFFSADKIHICFDQPNKDVQITIYDLYGRQLKQRILSGTDMEVALPNQGFSKQLYLIRIVSENIDIVQKLYR